MLNKSYWEQKLEQQMKESKEDKPIFTGREPQPPRVLVATTIKPFLDSVRDIDDQVMTFLKNPTEETKANLVSLLDDYLASAPSRKDWNIGFHWEDRFCADELEATKAHLLRQHNETIERIKENLDKQYKENHAKGLKEVKRISKSDEASNVVMVANGYGVGYVIHEGKPWLFCKDLYAPLKVYQSQFSMLSGRAKVNFIKIGATKLISLDGLELIAEGNTTRERVYKELKKKLGATEVDTGE